jgi:hypothetical protein
MTQEQALNILKMGHNAYITGPAGSGKTYLLNKYINYLKNKEVDVGITASTGIAATHIGGVTIHSWTGLGIRDSLSPYDLEALQEKQYLWKRFEKVKVLIIDEVSMLHHFRLDLVDKICREFKRNDKPFGGIQVILCGDFFQLPPVSKSYSEPSQFVYHSGAWQNADFKICYLEEQHRQTDDATISILNEIRANKISPKNLEILKSRMVDSTSKSNASGDTNTTDVSNVTRLYTHNIDVDSINERELGRLAGEPQLFDMIDRGGNELLIDLLKKSCLAPQKMKLKTGARVMFVKNNFEEGYVNGTLGTVIALGKAGPVVRTLTGKTIDVEPASWKIEEDGKVKAEIIQYPLRLAWAITVHKSQGMSLDSAEVDLSKSFEKGMGYVALSRVRSIDGLRLLGLNEMALRVSDEVLQHDEELRVKSEEAVEYLVGLENDEGKNVIRKIQADFLKSVGAKNTNPDEGNDNGKNPSASKSNNKFNNKFEKSGSTFKKIPTHHISRDLVLEGKTINEISRLRNMKIETIIDHLETNLLTDSLMDLSSVFSLVSKGKRDKILAGFKKAHKIDGPEDLQKEPFKNSDFKKLTLAPVKHAVGSDVTYLDIRIVRMMLFQQSKMI